MRAISIANWRASFQAGRPGSSRRERAAAAAAREETPQVRAKTLSPIVTHAAAPPTWPQLRLFRRAGVGMIMSFI